MEFKENYEYLSLYRGAPGGDEILLTNFNFSKLNHSSCQLFKNFAKKTLAFIKQR